MPIIKFVRVERDCPANKHAREDAEAGHAVRIIYDFDVMVDGEKRAQMEREFTGKGYFVQDADGRPIDPAMPHYRVGRKVDSQAGFEQTISNLLDAGKIPTLAEMAAKRDDEAKEKADKIVAEKEKMRVAAISTHAAAVYEAMRSAHDEIIRLAAAGACVRPDVTYATSTAIAKVEADAADWMAQVDADPSRFHIY